MTADHLQLEGCCIRKNGESLCLYLEQSELLFKWFDAITVSTKSQMDS